MGPDDLGDVNEFSDVAAVEAVLAGDHVVLCTEGTDDEGGLGVMLAFSGVCSTTPSILVSSNGKGGFRRLERRRTMVPWVTVPFILAVMCSTWPDSL